MTSGMKRKQSVAELWQEFCDNTSGHGLGAIIRNTGLVRIFWILMFLASLALSTYLVVVSIIEYFEFKATTVINEDFKESKIEFPSVTICNMNALDKHKLEKHGFHGNHSIALVMSQAVSPGKNIEWDHPPHKDHEKLYRNGSLAMSNLIYTYGRKIAEILKDEKLKAVYDNTCYFKRGSCPTWGFTETLTVYGLCYTFNAENSSHPHLHINRPGAGHGLILYMNIHEEHDVPTHHHHRGIKVLIHKRGTSVLSIHDEGITMLPGTFNVVGLTTVKDIYLPDPYTPPCKSQELKILQKLHYSKESCYQDCEAQLALKKCGCLRYDFYHNSDAFGESSYGSKIVSKRRHKLMHLSAIHKKAYIIAHSTTNHRMWRFIRHQDDYNPRSKAEWDT